MLKLKIFVFPFVESVIAFKTRDTQSATSHLVHLYTIYFLVRSLLVVFEHTKQCFNFYRPFFRAGKGRTKFRPVKRSGCRAPPAGRGTATASSFKGTCIFKICRIYSEQVYSEVYSE